MNISLNSKEISKIISNAEIKNSILKSWNFIEIDPPLLKRSERIKKSLLSDDSFWNVHIALCFLAKHISPKTFLEIGTRTGGSFCPTIKSGNPKLAISVDIWEGTYAGLPNSYEFATKQIQSFIESQSLDTEALLFKGSSHDLLEDIKQSNLKFELINVDGDHTKEGAWKDLKNAKDLLDETGAIIFDDITHCSHKYLLNLAHEFVEKYPEFELILNTIDDNGTAIFTKNIHLDKWINPSLSKYILAHNYQSLTRIDATSIDTNFKEAIKNCIKKNNINAIIETGTYRGNGSTKVICEAVSNNKKSEIFSIESNEKNIIHASEYLLKNNLYNKVQILHGLSIPKALIPNESQIQELIENYKDHKIYIDHNEDSRVKKYCDELKCSNINDSLLSYCLDRIDEKEELLIILDSAGHLGYIEFCYLLTLLKRKFFIALDDIFHLKHHESYRMIKADKRFKLVFKSNSKFGSVIATFDPNI